MKKKLIPLALLISAAAMAQNYSIPWYKIGGGGGSSSGTNGEAVYSVTGTIGQPDASRAMSGGEYALTGGFWNSVSVVPTPGAPRLSITRSGSNVIISWPSASGYLLQQSGTLTGAAAWSASGYAVRSAGGTNSIAFTPPAGALFFRLSGQ